MPSSRISIRRPRLRAVRPPAVPAAGAAGCVVKARAQRLSSGAARLARPWRRARARRWSISCAAGRPPRPSRPSRRSSLVLVGAVGRLVADRLGVGPQPGDRPQQAAEHQRQQAQRVDRVGLRMVALVGDLLGQHVHQPEDDDDDDRHDDDDELRQNHRRETIISGRGRATARGEAGKPRHPQRKPRAARRRLRWVS